MIDLHSHTFYSDGSNSPEELLQLALDAGLDALAVTDHDNLDGYDHLRRLPRPSTLELICGIEVTCTLGSKTAHLLGYFLSGEPASSFRSWLAERQQQRRDRNRRLARRLQQLGAAVEVEEAEALGRSMTGRPHFARVLIQKGYVRSIEEAFGKYLGEEGSAYVHHEAPVLEEGIRRIHEAGGIASLAHPIRLGLPHEDYFFATMSTHGLRAVEVFHSDHSPADRARYLGLAGKYNLAPTGGSDYHGTFKPNIRLGGVPVENWVLDQLRTR